MDKDNLVTVDIKNGYGTGYGNSNGDGYGYDNGIVFVSHDTPILGWWRTGGLEHFGKKIDTKLGAIHEWPYIPKLCSHGLHACFDAEDTRKWNSGDLFRVACSGWVKFQSDKFVCTRREIIKEEWEDRK